jgi:hypothetical protein
MAPPEWPVPGDLCPLQYAASRVETCPGARCPFWEPHFLGVPGCAVARLGIALDEQPKLVAFLLRVRLELAQLRGAEEAPRSPAAERVHSLFYLLPRRDR